MLHTVHADISVHVNALAEITENRIKHRRHEYGCGASDLDLNLIRFKICTQVNFMRESSNSNSVRTQVPVNTL